MAGIKYGIAKGVAAACSAGLGVIGKSAGANLPGKLALYVDPDLLAHVKERLTEGSILVVGTNGKTTVTALIADMLEAAGKRVICNRTGANLDSGVATAMLKTRHADWAVLETDELWMAKVLPFMQSRYVVLLDLFRDQLDRYGDIDVVQESLVKTLRTSPATTLIYNGDDPYCVAVANAVENPRITFGTAQDLQHLGHSEDDSVMCQNCQTLLNYGSRSYAHLGNFVCPNCGFGRPSLDYAVQNARVNVARASMEFELASEESMWNLRASFAGTYMVYNIAAAAVCAKTAGCSGAAVQGVLDAFCPRNGRAQTFEICGRRVFLNLAKNPVGFDQNINIVAHCNGDCAVALFVNDAEGDGRDVSWLWDVRFERLDAPQVKAVFVGGSRKRDVALRLKYAGVPAYVLEGPDALLGAMAACPEVTGCTQLYAIANYTMLVPVKRALEAAEQAQAEGNGAAASAASAASAAGAASAASATGAASAASATGAVEAFSNVPAAVPLPADEAPLVITWLFPDLLSLYGDAANIRVLERRLRWRGIPVRVKRVLHGQRTDFTDTDLVFVGSGPDREQALAGEALADLANDLRAFLDGGGALLAVSGGMQLLGRRWADCSGNEPRVVSGAAIFDFETDYADGARRVFGDVAVRSPLADALVWGYANHLGCMHLGADVRPFGTVEKGPGNCTGSAVDGLVVGHAILTYLHGPVLAKAPQVADALLAWAIGHREARTGEPARDLVALEDTAEAAAAAYLTKREGL